MRKLTPKQRTCKRRNRRELVTLLDILAGHPQWVERREHFKMLARMAARILSKGGKT